MALKEMVQIVVRVVMLVVTFFGTVIQVELVFGIRVCQSLPVSVILVGLVTGFVVRKT